jgi:hypothetical protein
MGKKKNGNRAVNDDWKKSYDVDGNKFEDSLLRRIEALIDRRFNELEARQWIREDIVVKSQPVRVG